MTAPAPSERCHTFYGVTDLCTRCGGTMEDHYSAHVLEGERRATTPQYSALADEIKNWRAVWADTEHPDQEFMLAILDMALRAEALEQRVKELDKLLLTADRNLGEAVTRYEAAESAVAKAERKQADLQRQLGAERLHGQALERQIDEVRARNAELKAAVAKAREGALTDDYVAWMRYVRHDNGVTTIEACDSDSPGAFQVYRALLELTQGKR